MSQTIAFIQRLDTLAEGERSCLRRLAGQPLDQSLPGFDLFTGLWWPLRQASPVAPRRETSWLVAKLYGVFPISNAHVPEDANRSTLPRILGRCEPRDEHGRPRFRRRFDALLCSPLSGLEPHLRWALSVVADAVAGRIGWAADIQGIDWAQLLNDLSIWDRGEEHRGERDIRDIWAEAYLNATRHADHQPQGAEHAD